MSSWFDIEMPPLDITVAARAIAAAWEESIRQVELRAGGMYVLDVTTEPLRMLGPHAAMRFAERVIDILKTYDEGRSQHIKFLRDELIRLQNVTIAPPVIIKRES